MVAFPKECKDCELEGCWPHSDCDGCENGSKNTSKRTCEFCHIIVGSECCIWITMEGDRHYFCDSRCTYLWLVERDLIKPL
jgi:hypothetical protein